MHMRVLIAGFVLPLICLAPWCAESAAEPSAFAKAFSQAGVKPKRELVIMTTAGDTLRGSYVRIADGPSLVVRRYIAPEDRFGLAVIASSQIDQVRLVSKRSSGARVFNGAMIGGACGAFLGFVAGSRNSGDVGPSDTRVLGAAAGFLLGGAAGLLTGAFTSTATSVESEVWPAR